jgi:hypothetical protein
MARLGELLIAARLCTTDQVEQALRAQVMWGGRLGTLLVELGFIDLDVLSRALGRQHGMPAALEHHFDKADIGLQSMLPDGLAAKHSVIPLLRLGTGKLAIASRDPLRRSACAEIANALVIAVDEIVVSIAPEQRIKYQLERVYGIARSARYLRVHGSVATFPELGDVPVPIDSDPEVVVPVELKATSGLAAATDRQAIPEPIDLADSHPPAPAEDLAAMLEQAYDAVKTSTPEEPGRDRRNYLRTLADDAPAPANALGRIAIRKVAVEAQPIPVIHEASADDAQTLADALRLIKRAPQRDRVADLALEALVQFAPACHAAMLMVVRGAAVIGWHWFCRTAVPPAELAMRTSDASLVARAIASNQTVRTAVAQLGPVDTKLVHALGAAEGDLVAVPVPIAGSVVCVVAAVVRGTTEERCRDAIAAIEAVAGAASAAFARLVRDASR